MDEILVQGRCLECGDGPLAVAISPEKNGEWAETHDGCACCAGTRYVYDGPREARGRRKLLRVE